MTMREHLSNFHKRQSAHHAGKAAFHATAAEHFKKLAGHIGKSETTEASEDSKGILAALAAMHEEQSQEHAGMGGFHAEQMEECSKAADGDLNKLVPTRISAVAPTPPGVRAVPRAGQPAPENITVPEEFAKLAQVED
ncbi:MAG: hypothetical protein JWN63_2575 [Candidatus Acidoferrum typicum]|nr:hypothetical protein [Candidatus Acidoferrum typicum]